MQGIMGFFKESGFHPGIGAVYSFDSVRDAIMAQDHGTANGKIVVLMQ